MNIKRKFVTFFTIMVMVMIIIPVTKVQATTDFKIISKTKVSSDEAREWAESRGATDAFIDLADLYWQYAEECGGVNPAIAYVQAGKETGFGRFGGVLDESYHNPCGLKNSSGGGDYDKKAHKSFDSWAEGVQAHLDHLALYAGAKGYPRSDTYDPRHFASIKGRATTTNELGSRWAPSVTYGEEVGKLYMELMDYSDVEYEKEKQKENTKKDKNFDIGKEITNYTKASDETPNPVKKEAKEEQVNYSQVIEKKKLVNTNWNKDKTTNIASTIGWKNDNGIWYYYKSDNTKAVGWIKPDENWYYLDTNDGSMRTGWFKEGKVWYYFEDSGIMVTGWKLINDNWYLFNRSGIMVTGASDDGSNIYYFKDSGEMITTSGWVKNDNKWYYTQTNGQVKIGWLNDNNSWYYLQGDGTMVSGANKIDGQVYFFDEGGSMYTGWKQINNKWYYFNKNGQRETGWIKSGSDYYYLYNTGAMVTGWIELDTAKYYLDDSGKMVTGWIKSEGNFYYLDPNTGRMMTSTSIEGYKLDSNGKAFIEKDTYDGDSDKDEDEIIDEDSDKDDDDYIVRPDKNIRPSSGSTIVIDPGHDYGKDYGAQSTIDGVKYSETVLDIQVADKLRQELEKRGYNVVMTRRLGEQPSYGSLDESLSHRVDMANKSNASFFISIHHNAASVDSAKGVETLYSDRSQDAKYGGNYDPIKISESRRLASEINNSIVTKLGLVNRGAKEQNLFVSRNSTMPAVLVECGFLTNPEEARRCADSESQQRFVEAIADAIARNF